MIKYVSELYFIKIEYNYLYINAKFNNDKIQSLFTQTSKMLEQLNLNKDKCLVNMWCGTGKTRTFTIKTFLDNYNLTVFVFPSLGLINQYNNDYILNKEEPFIHNLKIIKYYLFVQMMNQS